MRKALLMTTGLAWLALTGTAGAVSVTVTPGPLDPQYFESEPANANGFTIDGITWTLGSGTAHTDKGTTPNVDAAPLGEGGTTYMGVQAESSEIATFSTPQTRLAIYWGSIDANVCSPGSSSCGNTNSVTFTFSGGGSPFELTGNDLMTMYGALGEGLQGNALDNQLVTITGLPSFTSVTFASTGTAFEFSLVPIPEPSTWAMMALGFVGLGYAGYRQRRMLIGAANV